jgi:2-amino-4-hydroxy-6-hydroxymethyldihydropteridine diphosphokinase
MPIAFIGMGSNIEPRLDFLMNALKELEKWVTICKVSSIYETEPWGNPELLPFYNAVVKIQTNFSPYELLGILLSIEKQFGRIRNKKWENRTLDLDLLDYQGVIFHEENLILPHPYIQERDFVVVPWYEIDKHWVLSNHLKIKDLYFNYFSNSMLKKMEM